ncbi:hypothetical protein A2U01_0116633, partial [Trifolium medium]|nr:hypothetical protein [Trifolium medium]
MWPSLTRSLYTAGAGGCKVEPDAADGAEEVEVVVLLLLLLLLLLH